MPLLWLTAVQLSGYFTLAGGIKLFKSLNIKPVTTLELSGGRTGQDVTDTRTQPFIAFFHAKPTSLDWGENEAFIKEVIINPVS